jgi:hypothetical protein
MVRYALLALVLLTPLVASAQSQVTPPAPPQAPIDTSTATGVLTRAVAEVDRHATGASRPSAWVDTTVAPRVHTWMPLPHWELLSLTVPEEFRSGLLYTGGAKVYPWPRLEWRLSTTVGNGTKAAAPKAPHGQR